MARPPKWLAQHLPKGFRWKVLRLLPDTLRIDVGVKQLPNDGVLYTRIPDCHGVQWKCEFATFTPRWLRPQMAEAIARKFLQDRGRMLDDMDRFARIAEWNEARRLVHEASIKRAAKNWAAGIVPAEPPELVEARLGAAGEPAHRPWDPAQAR